MCIRDSTGTIVVEIDDEYLPRETFDQNTQLRIKGEVDRRWNQRQRYIDVKSVQIVRLAKLEGGARRNEVALPG